MVTNTAVLERHTNAISQVCARPDSVTLFEATSAHLRQVVGFDGALWFGTDPATMLPTAPVRIEENVEPLPNQCTDYWNREFLVEDVMLFRTLARAAQPAATLYGITDGNPGLPSLVMGYACILVPRTNRFNPLPSALWKSNST